mmetsp:Transcript_3667/g.6336  ORF Transcript_3667/g.6336 Transcript_3667/m.6336 type:complete len:136 (-) Transcript_3667:81-488(-)
MHNLPKRSQASRLSTWENIAFVRLSYVCSKAPRGSAPMPHLQAVDREGHRHLLKGKGRGKEKEKKEKEKGRKRKKKKEKGKFNMNSVSRILSFLETLCMIILRILVALMSLVSICHNSSKLLFFYVTVLCINTVC